MLLFGPENQKLKASFNIYMSRYQQLKLYRVP